MGHFHYVRWGAMGTLGLCLSGDGTDYPRDSRVILRTERGLEIGQVLSDAEPDDGGRPAATIVRGMTVEDELLAARLERNRHDAMGACLDRFSRLGCTVPLVDVELLFDGQTLWFYFLGDPPPEANQVTEELAQLYESHAQLSNFAAVLTAGCGPDCGTEQGGSCKSCSSGCALSGRCSSHHD